MHHSFYLNAIMFRCHIFILMCSFMLWNVNIYAPLAYTFFQRLLYIRFIVSVRVIALQLGELMQCSKEMSSSHCLLLFRQFTHCHVVFIYLFIFPFFFSKACFTSTSFQLCSFILSRMQLLEHYRTFPVHSTHVLVFAENA